MKKTLRGVYYRVGAKTFKRGVENLMKLVLLIVLGSIIMIFACKKTDEQPKPLNVVYDVYRVHTEEVKYQTAKDNPRLKTPITTETVIYVIEN